MELLPTPPVVGYFEERNVEMPPREIKPVYDFSVCMWICTVVVTGWVTFYGLIKGNEGSF